MAFRRDRIFALAGLCVGACFVLAAVLSIVFSQGSATASYGNDANAVKAMPPAKLGPSGLPVPRFVSLKRKKVNVRKGPSTDHRVKWVYTSKGYPVEIIAESDNWRRVRDAEGTTGWVLHSLLSAKRTAVVAPWRRHVGGAATAYVIGRADPSDNAATRATTMELFLPIVLRLCCTGMVCVWGSLFFLSFSFPPGYQSCRRHGEG